MPGRGRFNIKLIYRISWSLVNAYSEVVRVIVHLSTGDRTSEEFFKSCGSREINILFNNVLESSQEEIRRQRTTYVYLSVVR